MEFDWSEQSPHIRTLYRAWQVGDGYDEATIQAAEARLGTRLPTTLRSFYAAWGRRHDMTRLCEHLLAPDELRITPDALICCVENQAVMYWAVRREALGEADPPVSYADTLAWDGEEPVLGPWRASHPRVSCFLDDLTYKHAFGGGAVHGGSSRRVRPEQRHVEWLEQHWRQAAVTPMFRSQEPDTPDTPDEVLLGSPLYVREGQAVLWFLQFDAVTREAEALDEIGEALGATWEQRW